MGLLLILLLPVIICLSASKEDKSGGSSLFDINNNGKTDLFDIALLSILFNDSHKDD